MNVGLIILTVHVVIFGILLWRDIYNGTIEAVVHAPDSSNMSPASIVFGDFCWEFFVILYVLIIIAFVISIPISAINKYFQNKYEVK